MLQSLHMRIIFFDTETTGNTKDSYLVQLAVKERGIGEPLLNALYKPPTSIPIECTMIHHISNKMVSAKPTFKDSPEYQTIKALFEDQENIAVAHNAAFDAQILANESIFPSNILCTFKVIRALDSEARFAMHKLQYLRYALEIELDVPAHDALADVLVLEKVFEYELKEVMEKYELNEEDAMQKMIEITKIPISFKQFDFGKHKGKTLEEVALTDRGYLEWLLAQKRMSNTDEADWVYTLEKHLGVI